MKHILFITLLGVLSCTMQEQVMPEDSDPYTFTVINDGEFMYTVVGFETNRMWKLDYLLSDGSVFASVSSNYPNKGCASLKHGLSGGTTCARLTFKQVEETKCITNL